MPGNSVMITSMPCFFDYVKLSESASTKEAALHELNKAGYDVSDGDILRTGRTEAGEGFWSKTNNFLSTRMIYFGPGEYVTAHTHDRDEVFHVTGGSCYVWSKPYLRWERSFYIQGESFTVPKGIPHYLVSTASGLCMHTFDISERATDEYYEHLIL